MVNRGIDNPDGIIMFVAGLVVVLIGLYNLLRRRTMLTWVILLISVIVFVVAFIDLQDTRERARELMAVSELAEMSDVDSSWFMGTGLHLILAGSCGVALSGVLKSCFVHLAKSSTKDADT
jgi:nitrate/nitrite transporter NarK